MTERRTRPDGERPLASPTLPGSSSSARSARGLLRDELTGRFPPSVLDDLLLLVSELVSNAAAASSERFRLTVTCDDDMLRVELIDSSEVFPQLADRGPLAENGRGLWLIDALALDWGAVPQPFGKMVWFTLRVSSQSSLDPLTDQVADHQGSGIEKTLTELVAVDEDAPGVAGADATLQRVGAEPRDRPAANARCTPMGAAVPLPPRRSDRSGRPRRRDRPIAPYPASAQLRTAVDNSLVSAAALPPSPVPRGQLDPVAGVIGDLGATRPARAARLTIRDTPA